MGAQCPVCAGPGWGEGSLEAWALGSCAQKCLLTSPSHLASAEGRLAVSWDKLPSWAHARPCLHAPMPATLCALELPNQKELSWFEERTLY